LVCIEAHRLLSFEGIVGYTIHTGFTDLSFNQTIFGTLPESAEDEPAKAGHGEGFFLVIPGREK